MTPSIWNRIDLLARLLTPSFFTLLLVIISVVPFRLLDFTTAVPLLPLISVYHWAIFRPQLLPIYVVFLLGVLQDVLTGSPIGVNALIFLLVYGSVMSQKAFISGRSFFILWIGFALIAAGALGIKWLVISILNITIVESKTAILQYLLTLGFFPAAAWTFLRWQKTFLKLE
jgi:rod shape-determining protein MreD